MPSFFSMRSLPDDLPPLGERLPRPEERPVADQPEVEVAPGILRDPQTGRLRTNIPTEADKHFPATRKSTFRTLVAPMDLQEAIEDRCAFSHQDLVQLRDKFKLTEHLLPRVVADFSTFYSLDPSTRIWSPR